MHAVTVLLQETGVLVLNWTLSRALLPPLTFPYEQETPIGDVVAVQFDGNVLLTTGEPLTASIWVSFPGNVTLRTTWVAVAPPEPAWLKNLVTESASLPAVMMFGATSSATHDAGVRLGDVPIVGVLQMLPLAARPRPTDANSTARPTNATVPAMMSSVERVRMNEPSPLRDWR
jgi:hypothetical protein